MEDRGIAASTAWTVPGKAKVFAKLFCFLSTMFFLVACSGSSSPATAQLDLSGDSAATDIVLSDVELDQYFQSSLFSYTATVSLLVPTTTVTVTPSHANATITVNGAVVGSGVASDKVTLDQGVNTINVVITAEDGVITTTYTFIVTRLAAENLAQRAYIKASDTEERDHFGGSIALDGDTLIVGAPYADRSLSDGTVEDVGAAYVFNRDASGVWNQRAIVEGEVIRSYANCLIVPELGIWPVNACSERFGASLDVDGDTLVIGAPGADIIVGTLSEPDVIQNVGAAYVFNRDASGAWTRRDTLGHAVPGDCNIYIASPYPLTSCDDSFGFSIALNGDTLVVGAPNEYSSATGIDGDERDSSAWGAGAVYVFTRTIDGFWSQQAYIKASNTESGDTFGYSVALDSNTLAVGATREDSSATGIDGDQSDNSANDSGAVYVFTRNSSGVWSQQAYIKASNSSQDFGTSLSLDGDTLTVGASEESSSATGIDGDQLDNNAYRAGAVYVFTRSANDAWSQQAYIKASNTGTEDHFGHSIALEGDTFVVGAILEDSFATGINGDQSNNSAEDAGAIYMFSRDATNIWSQQAYIKASNTDAEDRFGFSVAVNGHKFASAAFGEGSIATGVNGDQSDNNAIASGAVYIFD